MSKHNQSKSDKRLNTYSHSCSCCSMSRRSFLGAAAACTATLTTGCASLESLHTTPSSHEEIDLASFRPRPKVRVMSVIAREKPPYWLGWPGTAYDVEGERTRYTEAIAGAARRVGIEILEERRPLEENAAVAAFVKKVKAEKPDAVFVTLQHFQSWGSAGEIAKAGVPTIVLLIVPHPASEEMANARQMRSGGVCMGCSQIGRTHTRNARMAQCQLRATVKACPQSRHPCWNAFAGSTSRGDVGRMNRCSTMSAPFGAASGMRTL